MRSTDHDGKDEKGLAPLSRRNFLVTGLGLAAAAAASSLASRVSAQAGRTTEATSIPPQSSTTGRRKLGSLEVSSVGIGVQNMSRRYETTVPHRPEIMEPAWRRLSHWRHRRVLVFSNVEAPAKR